MDDGRSGIDPGFAIGLVGLVAYGAYRQHQRSKAQYMPSFMGRTESLLLVRRARRRSPGGPTGGRS